MSLERRDAVVTGGGFGGWAGVHTAFVEEGASVSVHDIDLDRAKETVAAIEAAGGTTVARRCGHLQGR